MVSLLHCAASMASGVPRKPGWSWKGGEKGQKGLVTRWAINRGTRCARCPHYLLCSNIDLSFGLGINYKNVDHKDR